MTTMHPSDNKYSQQYIQKTLNNHLKSNPVDNKNNFNHNLEVSTDLDDICTSISQVPINPLYRENFTNSGKLILPETSLVLDDRFWREQVNESEKKDKVMDQEDSEFTTMSSTSVDTYTPNKTTKDRKTLCISNWTVAVDNEHLLIVGLDRSIYKNSQNLFVIGQAKDGAPIIRLYLKRISQFIFYDNDGTICSLYGPSVLDPDLPDYIREKFKHGIPADWKQIVQTWLHYINSNCPPKYKWPSLSQRKDSVSFQSQNESENSELESHNSSKTAQQLRKKIAKLKGRLRAMALRESLMYGNSSSTLLFENSNRKTNLTNNLENLNIDSCVNNLRTQHKNTEVVTFFQKPNIESLSSSDSEISSDPDSISLHLRVNSDDTNINNNNKSQTKSDKLKNDEKQTDKNISGSPSFVSIHFSELSKVSSVKDQKLPSKSNSSQKIGPVPLDPQNFPKNDAEVFLKPPDIETLKKRPSKSTPLKNKLTSSDPNTNSELDTNITLVGHKHFVIPTTNISKSEEKVAKKSKTKKLLSENNETDAEEQIFSFRRRTRSCSKSLAETSTSESTKTLNSNKINKFDSESSPTKEINKKEQSLTSNRSESLKITTNNMEKQFFSPKLNTSALETSLTIERNQIQSPSPVLNKSVTKTPPMNRSKVKNMVLIETDEEEEIITLNKSPKLNTTFVKSPKNENKLISPQARPQKQNKKTPKKLQMETAENAKKHNKKLNKSVPEKNKTKISTELSKTVPNDVDVFIKTSKKGQKLNFNARNDENMNSSKINHLNHENVEEISSKSLKKCGKQLDSNNKHQNAQPPSKTRNKLKNNYFSDTTSQSNSETLSSSENKESSSSPSGKMLETRKHFHSTLQSFQSPVISFSEGNISSQTSVSSRGRRRVATLPFWQGARLKKCNEKTVIVNNFEKLDVDFIANNTTTKNYNRDSTLTYDKAFNSFKKPKNPIKMQLMSTFRDSISKKSAIKKNEKYNSDNPESPVKKKTKSSSKETNKLQSKLKNNIVQKLFDSPERNTPKNGKTNKNKKKISKEKILVKDVEVLHKLNPKKSYEESFLGPKQTTLFKVPKPKKIKLPTNPNELSSFFKKKHPKKEAEFVKPQTEPTLKKRKMFRNEDWLQSDEYIKLIEQSETSPKFVLKFNTGVEIQDDKFSEVSALL